MGVIKEEQREGKRMYWFQMIMQNKGKRSIIQMLSPWDVTAMGSSAPAEVVMKMGDQPAMKMNGGSMGQAPSSKTDWREFCAKSTFVGEESVTVPAGTFKTRHYHSDEWGYLGVAGGPGLASGQDDHQQGQNQWC